MKEFDRLLTVVKRLRKECPWDRAQNHTTLKPFMVEELHEALEAIDQKDDKKLAEELGDQLLHILMHAVMGAEENKFDIKEIIQTITEKMIRRHPHVFLPAGRHGAGGKAKTQAQVLKKWEEIKRAERRKK